MFHFDGVRSKQESYDIVLKNLDNIKVEAISEIQKDLSPYDVRSLVFLLYDNPGTALERLIFLQRISRDNHGSNMELLCDWAVHAKLRVTWRLEFLEALTVCQLYQTIKKLGFDVESVKAHFSLTNVYQARYINPIKKVLYVLCENIEKDNLNKIKKSLFTYDINVDEYDSCELILLELLKNKLISTGSQADGNNTGIKCDLKLLANIVQACKGVAHYAKILDKAETYINSEIKTIEDFKILSPVTPKAEIDITNNKEENTGNLKKDKNVQDALDMLKNLIEENLSLNLKADRKKQSVDIASPDFYEIKNPERVGLCYIINQEIFYPSKYSIENKIVTEPLEDRDGSSLDKEILKKTMTSLKFHVETSDNLIHSDIIPNIRKIIANNFQTDDSIFVLCILSHGVEGHVYGVDSVPVAVKKIEQLLDSEDAKKLRHKPKILIIQACQTNHDQEPSKLIADGPMKIKKIRNCYLPKSDIMILWATAPEFEAYRVGNKGSVFIFLLCYIILQNDKNRHFAEICTKLTQEVSDYIARLDHAQLPICITTLRKSLYLKMPTSLS